MRVKTGKNYVCTRGDKNKSGLLWLNAKFSAKMEPTKTYHIPNQWKFYEDFAELYKF